MIKKTTFFLVNNWVFADLPFIPNYDIHMFPINLFTCGMFKIFLGGLAFLDFPSLSSYFLTCCKHQNQNEIFFLFCHFIILNNTQQLTADDVVACPPNKSLCKIEHQINDKKKYHTHCWRSLSLSLPPLSLSPSLPPVCVQARKLERHCCSVAADIRMKIFSTRRS